MHLQASAGWAKEISQKTHETANRRGMATPILPKYTGAALPPFPDYSCSDYSCSCAGVRRIVNLPFRAANSSLQLKKHKGDA
jgi:hypothetical protein